MTDKETIRVVTANLRHCEPWPEPGEQANTAIETPAIWKKRAATAARELADTQPDVICLQEVDYRQSRSGWINQLEVVRDELGWPREQARFCSFFNGFAEWGTLPVPTLLRRIPAPRFRVVRRGAQVLPVVAHTKNTTVGSFIAGILDRLGTERPFLGGYGVAILTRFPVLNWRSVSLGAQPFTMRQGADGRELQLGQVRALLAATVKTPVGLIEVGCTHLELDAVTGRRQLKHAWNLINETGNPALLAGDLNMSAEAVQRTLSQPDTATATGLTIPSDQPRRALDHILVAGAEITAGKPVRLAVSDHRALPAVVRIPVIPSGQ